MLPVLKKINKICRIFLTLFVVMGIFLFHAPFLYADIEEVTQEVPVASESPEVLEQPIPPVVEDVPEVAQDIPVIEESTPVPVPVLVPVAVEEPAPVTDARPALLGKFSFEDDQIASAPVHPSSDDYSTSIILYVSNGDDPETWTYEPETVGFGEFHFSDYFYLGSPVGKYLLVEYHNDGQTFSCYGMAFADCIANSHFISQFSFKVNDTVLDPMPENNSDPLPIISAVTDPLTDDTAMTTTVDIDSASIVETPVEAPASDVPVDSSENISQPEPAILTAPDQPAEVGAPVDVLPPPTDPEP